MAESVWEQRQFSDLYLVPSRNGLARSRSADAEGPIMINMGDLFRYPIMRSIRADRVPATPDEMRRFAVETGDLLFARRSFVASGAGKSAIVAALDGPAVFESSIIRVRLDSKIADPSWYFYYFKSRIGRGRIESLVNQVAVSGIKSSDLAKLIVDVPPIAHQRRTASILGAYDDLIEVNRRRIALLEEMARRLFEEWFIHFRFPGHQETEMKDGRPEGWQQRKLGELAEVRLGKMLDAAKNRGELMPYLANVNVRWGVSTYRTSA